MSSTTRFRKRPVEVEAVQWTGCNLVELAEFTEGKFWAVGSKACVLDVLHDTWVQVFPGQWVIRGVQGEFYPIAEDVLAETYEQVLR